MPECLELVYEEYLQSHEAASEGAGLLKDWYATREHNLGPGPLPETGERILISTHSLNLGF